MKEGHVMRSFTERETSIYHRNALICFLCVGVCLFFDIQKYIQAGHFYFDWNIILSVVLYALLIYLGVRSIRKARKTKPN